MNHFNDRSLIIVQNAFCVDRKKETVYKLRYPKNIKYEEMNPNVKSYGEEDISFNVFEIGGTSGFYIFGDSGKWAAYSASDWHVPFFSITSDKENIDFIKKIFNPSEDDIEVVTEYVPPEYKKDMMRVSLNTVESEKKFEEVLFKLTKDKIFRKDGVCMLDPVSFLITKKDGLGNNIIQIHNPKLGIENIVFFK
ncbi:hypothetical protein Dip510_001874 [Elusimicrobium posterum]|uniref:hypothetical protein n=1 Tax=Elusimicrobium posterum TaxID=3116653 RepID=UPI003C77D23D